MKIVQVQTQAEAAGAQRVSDMVGEGLRARGHQVTTVFMYRKTDVYDRDEHAVFIHRQAPGGLVDEVRAAMGLIGHLRRERPDAVISYQYWGNLFGTIGGRLAGADHLIVNQSGNPKTSGLLGIVSFLDKLMGMVGAFDFSVVNSAATMARFDDYPRSYKARLKLIDHGVVSAPDAISRETARQSFDLPQNVPLIVTTGRQTEDKNQSALIAALAKLEGVHLALAGVGPLQDTLLAQAKDEGVRDRVHMVGELTPNRVLEFLSAGDVFGFASRDETFGLSVAEAALSGLPVIAYDLPVLREVLVSPQAGSAAHFVPRSDGDSFADGFARVLGDTDYAARLSAAGRALKARYDPDVMCARYEELLMD